MGPLPSISVREQNVVDASVGREFSSFSNSISLQYLGHGQFSVHTGTTMWFTVIIIITGCIEFLDESITLFTQLFIHRDGFLIDTLGDRFFVKDHIVRTTLIDDPLDGITLADRHLGRYELETTTIGSHLHLLGFGRISGLSDSRGSNTGS